MEISATISESEVSDRCWDAVVIGAGPAGAMAAHSLARSGLAVLLVDHARFPRPKICGCCLNPRALATLTDAGFDGLVQRCGGVQLRSLVFASTAEQATVPFAGFSLSRDTFDAALAVLNPITDPRVRGISLRRHGREVTVRSRLVIGAGGLGSRLLGTQENLLHIEAQSRLGAGIILEDGPSSFQMQTVYMACANGGYVGLVRLEDGRLNVAAAFDPDFVKQSGGLGQSAVRVLRDAGFPAIDNLAALPWRGTPLLTRHADIPAAYRVFLLGDAASFVEPFTGEGMAWALASGAAIAPLAVRACREWEPSLIGIWKRRYRQAILRRQHVCRFAAFVLREPKLVRLAIHALHYFPCLASPIIHYINYAANDAVRSGTHMAGAASGPIR